MTRTGQSPEPHHDTLAATGSNAEIQVLEEPALHAAPEKLPPGQQEVVGLLGLEELPLTEAVKNIGMSILTLNVAAGHVR